MRISLRKVKSEVGYVWRAIVCRPRDIYSQRHKREAYWCNQERTRLDQPRASKTWEENSFSHEK